MEEDADTGKLLTLPAGVAPSAIVETSSLPVQNRHFHWIFKEPLPAAEGIALVKLAYRKCGGDSCNGDPSHVWRVPGSLNHPDYAKIERGRPAEPQAVRIIGGSRKFVDAAVLRTALEAMPDRVSATEKEPEGWQAGGSTDLDEILARLPETVRAKLEYEDPADRSKHCANVMLLLFEHGLTDDEALLVAQESEFAAKFRDRGDLRREVSSCRAEWRRKGSKRSADYGMFEDLTKAAEPSAKRKAYAISKLSDLKEKLFMPARYLVDGLLSEGCSLLSGKPKSGKSWLALDVARAVATGGDTMGRRCEQGSVLLLALEDPERRLKSRFEKLQTDWDGDLDFATDWPQGKEAVALFGRWAAEAKNPRLIVVDTLAKVKAPPAKGRGEGYSHDYEATGLIQEFSKRTGISVLCIHHTRKSDADDAYDTVSGTLGVNAAFDSLLVLKREAKTGRMVLHGRGRDMPEFEQPLEFDKDSCRWNAGPSFEDLTMNDTKRAIFDLLRNSAEPLTATQIHNATGIKYDVVRMTLRRAVEKGEIKFEGNAKYSKIENDFVNF